MTTPMKLAESTAVVVFEELLSTQKKLSDDLAAIKKVIEATRALCPHDMRSVGYDSHKKHFECAICKETEEH